MSTLLPVEGRWEHGIWAGQGGKSRVTGSLGESGHPRGGGPRAEHPGSRLGNEELGRPARVGARAQWPRVPCSHHSC